MPQAAAPRAKVQLSPHVPAIIRDGVCDGPSALVERPVSHDRCCGKWASTRSYSPELAPGAAVSPRPRRSRRESRSTSCGRRADTRKMWPRSASSAAQPCSTRPGRSSTCELILCTVPCYKGMASRARAGPARLGPDKPGHGVAVATLWPPRQRGSQRSRRLGAGRGDGLRHGLLLSDSGPGGRLGPPR